MTSAIMDKESPQSSERGASSSISKNTLTQNEKVNPEIAESQAIEGQFDSAKIPRADGGKDAWLFLMACFVLEALVWGMSENSICQKLN